MDRDEMSKVYRGPPIDASYQVSVHLAEWFQRRRIKKKSTNQKHELSVAAMFVNGSGRNEQSLQRTFHRCFLPSFDSFGQWWPCLLMDRDEMSNLYGGRSIDGSYQVSVHLVEGF